MGFPTRFAIAFVGLALIGGGTAVFLGYVQPMLEASRIQILQKKHSGNLDLVAMAIKSYDQHTYTIHYPRGVSVPIPTPGTPGNERLPPGGTYSPSGEPRHGWMTYLLPQLGLDDVYTRVDFNRPWNDPSQRVLFVKPVPMYQSPIIKDPTHDSSGYAVAHFAGNQLVLLKNDGMKVADITDGLGTTVVAGDAAGQYVAWGSPENLRDLTLGLAGNPAGFGGPDLGRTGPGALLLMADGSVQWVSASVAPAVLKALATPAGGEPAPKLP